SRLWRTCTNQAIRRASAAPARQSVRTSVFRRELRCRWTCILQDAEICRALAHPERCLLIIGPLALQASILCRPVPLLSAAGCHGWAGPGLVIPGNDHHMPLAGLTLALSLQISPVTQRQMDNAALARAHRPKRIGQSGLADTFRSHVGGQP